jgi:hypothetical protein
VGEKKEPGRVDVPTSTVSLWFEDE